MPEGLILKRGSGPEKAPDLERWAADMPLPMLALFVTLLEYIIRGQDSQTVLEMYVAAANRWNGLGDHERKRAAGEGEDKYFTVEALERAEEDMEQARKVVSKSGLLLGPDGEPINPRGEG